MAKVFLRYSFIFDPSELWSSKTGFEADLAGLFRARGIGAERVDNPNQASNERMIILFPISREELARKTSKKTKIKW